ncbi:MAG: hypothetical protein HYW78_03780 [Parcubacteria group bacterium]|nr:hypothetical protein [Parcubacteria group bacterium]
MKKTVLFLCLAICISAVGCQSVVTEYSETLKEDAVILETVYTPSTHETVLEQSYGSYGSNSMIGYGSSGTGIRLGNSGLQVTEVRHPEKFAVVFKCKHGKFIISRKAIYDRFNGLDGSKVVVSYREVYKTTFDDESGQKKMISRILMDYDFIDAVLAEE